MRNENEQLWKDREGQLFHIIISSVNPDMGTDEGRFFISLEILETGEFLSCELES